MKRLVICCDGTWKRAQDAHVSNIEKLARTVRSNAGGVQQTVFYVDGVGSGYKVDRALGGALGLGLRNNLESAYRFLALNYVPGDQVFVFGFSRGAFTARSLVGMIDRVGLVRAEGMADGSLATAVERYRTYWRHSSRWAESLAEFRRDYCHRHVCIPFLGVFDTVEALGPRAKFHDIAFLENSVAVGRQALAIDDRRRIFWPRLWSGDASLAESGRVRQVWFEGFHSDVGGGVAETGLSDTTLVWMATEATTQGLVFDEEVITSYVGRGSLARRHSSMNPVYWSANLFMRTPLATSRRHFARGWRVLEPPGSLGVRISSSAREHFDERTYARPNVAQWCREAGDDLEGHTESVVAYPEATDDRLRERIREAAAAATRAGGQVHACPSPEHVTHL